MALFALWRDRGDEPAETTHRRVADASHLAPERATSAAIETRAGRWQFAAFSAATRFYTAGAQLWLAQDEACVMHGLAWRMEGGRARLLDAAALAALLPTPNTALLDDVAGEFAVARLLPCGTLQAFTDPAGVHQLFHRPDRPDAVASRARLLAALADDLTPDPEAGLWSAAIGYRVGAATGWRGVRQLPQATMLSVSPDSAATLQPSPDPARPPARRGFAAAGGVVLLGEGMEQAKAAIRLAAGDGPLDLPVTGGKDSRAVLALALAAGLRDRLTPFTRGYAGHPDVRAGQQIAAALGVPHRREPPLGSDDPADLDPEPFAARMAAHAWQTDGGIGGWDHLVATRTGTGTLVTGHMGEVLKAYSKQPPPSDFTPDAMVRLQGPFDPLGLLRPDARAGLVETLAAQMAQARSDGALADDLPDLFYWRNRLPNWLGGIRGVRSHERQPVMPLGAPALQRLAFLLTPAERRAELVHWRIVRDCAPELAGLPFAHQRWSPALGDAPDVVPVLAEPGAPLFGTWQWSINRVPAVRAWLAEFLARTDLPLWDGVDRAAVLELLREHRFDYLEGISFLGLVAAAFHQAGLIERVRIEADLSPVRADLVEPKAVLGQPLSFSLSVQEDGPSTSSGRTE